MVEQVDYEREERVGFSLSAGESDESGSVTERRDRRRRWPGGGEREPPPSRDGDRESERGGVEDAVATPFQRSNRRSGV